MNWLDITALALVLGGAFLGWRNGLLRWAFMLAGTIAGAILAGQFYTDLEVLAQGTIDSEALRQTIAFSVIFIGTLLAALLLSFVAKTVLKLLLLGWVDSLAGMTVGALAGALSASVFVSVLAVVPSESTQMAVIESGLAKALLDATSFMLVFLPPEFDAIEDLLERGAQLKERFWSVTGAR